MQANFSNSKTVKLKETENWYSLYVDWQCVSSWVSKNKITEEVKNSLDEIKIAYEEWKKISNKKWFDNALEKYHEILERFNKINNKNNDEVIDFDDGFDNNVNNDFDNEDVDNFDNEDLDEYFNKQPIDEFKFGLMKLRNKDMLNKKEAEEYFKKLRDKWLELKKEWRNIEEVFEKLNEYYDIRRYSLLAYDFHLWIVWFKEIKFFEVNNFGEIETIYSIFFEEDQKAKKKGDYSYLDNLLKWSYLLKRTRLFDKEEAEEFMKKLINKWLELKKEWRNMEEVYKEINRYYNAQTFSLYQYKLFLEKKWNEIKFYRVKENWEKETIASIIFKEKILSEEEMEEYILKMKEKWLKLKEEWRDIREVYDELWMDTYKQNDSFLEHNISIEIVENSIILYKMPYALKWSIETNDKGYIFRIPFKKRK